MPLPTYQALAGLHLAVLLFGFAGLFGKWLDLPPVAIVLGRTLIAAAALGVLVAVRGERARFAAGLAGNGIVLAVHWVAFFEAIRVSTIAIGLLGYASFPLFVLILERALPAALAKAKPGTPAFRAALRDAIEQEREIVGCQGVFNMSATNHNGMDERARVLVTVKDGRFRLLPE